MNTELLNKSLVQKNLLSRIIYFEELASTNGYSKENHFELEDNTIVLTSNQTNGKGRFGRPWYTAKNENLTFTLIKDYGIRIDEIHMMNFYTSYILFLTIKLMSDNFRSNELFLKWPNDLLLNRKKIAGILLDVKDLNSDLKKFIIGIGINVNQQNFPEEIKLKASSLKNEFKTDFIIEDLLIEFIEQYYKNLNLLEDSIQLMHLWKSNSDFFGKKVKFTQFADGNVAEVKLVDIDFDGGLIVSDDSGKLSKFYSGEINIE